MALLLTLVTALAAAPAVWLAGPVPGAPTRLLATPDGLLAGSDSGLYRLGDAGWTLLLTRGGVRDLARTDAATLVATGAGLFEWRDGSAAPVPVGLGAGARVQSVAVDGSGRVWVGTEVGLFVRERGARFRRELSLPAGAVERVRVAGDQVWVAARAALWRRTAGGVFESQLRRLDPGWWELVDVLIDGDAVLLAVPRGVWRVDSRGAEALDLGIGSVRALRRTDGRQWIAAERGLFQLAGGRPDASALSGEVFDIAVEGARLVAALDRGIAAVALDEPPAAVGLRLPPRDLDLPALQRAVLSYQGLGPRRMNQLEERAETAALLPEVTLGFSAARDRDRGHDLDETFSSGALHSLRDSGSGQQTDLELSLEFSWDLADHRDPRRALAVSKERRELVELRDQVLERVNRLYFERRRVLAALAAQPSDADGTELEIRAEELAAQLDAWTGGLFTRLATPSPPASRSQP